MVKVKRIIPLPTPLWRTCSGDSLLSLVMCDPEPSSWHDCIFFSLQKLQVDLQNITASFPQASELADKITRLAEPTAPPLVLETRQPLQRVARLEKMLQLKANELQVRHRGSRHCRLLFGGIFSGPGTKNDSPSPLIWHWKLPSSMPCRYILGQVASRCVWLSFQEMQLFDCDAFLTYFSSYHLKIKANCAAYILSYSAIVIPLHSEALI